MIPRGRHRDILGCPSHWGLDISLGAAPDVGAKVLWETGVGETEVLGVG